MGPKHFSRTVNFLIFLIASCFIFGCSQSDTNKENSKRSDTSPPTQMKTVGPRKIPFDAPSKTEISAQQKVPKDQLKTESDKSIASLPRTAAPSPPFFEKITGYKLPAEYFAIESRNYPQGIVAVTLPGDYEKNPDRKYPLVIAFGGAGECAKSPRQGALAWLHYYKADEAAEALEHNRLTSHNFRNLVTQSQLRQLNTKLKDIPYKGLILACPSSPLVPTISGPELPEYEEYIMNELIPALKSRYRVQEGAIGVDGVSMGGTRSMYYGLKYPEVFKSIGAIQGAFGSHLDLYAYLVKTNRDLLRDRAIQLVTSDHDYLASSSEKMHKLLSKFGIPHQYLVLTGPHDYIFNQGPGVISLLIFHCRALR